MNQKCKTAVVKEFKHGTDIDKLAHWCAETRSTIEQVIRDALLRQEKQAARKWDA